MALRLRKVAHVRANVKETRAASQAKPVAAAESREPRAEGKVRLVYFQRLHLAVEWVEGRAGSAYQAV